MKVERNINNRKAGKFRVEAGILPSFGISRAKKVYSLLRTSEGLVYDLAEPVGKAIFEEIITAGNGFEQEQFLLKKLGAGSLLELVVSNQLGRN